MALFESTWDTQTALSSLSAPNKKHDGNGRKRKSEDGVAVGPNINLDKLMRKMANAGKDNERKAKGKATKDDVKEVKGKDRRGSKAERRDRPGKQVKEGNGIGTAAKMDGKKTNSKTDTPNTTSSILINPTLPPTSTPTTSTSPPKPRGQKRKDESEPVPKSKKQKKREQQAVEGAKVPKKNDAAEKPHADGGSLTALQNSMKSNLEGARFRFINEQLYKSSSDAAQELMRKEPQVYAEYHTGFRHQTKSWPTNPVKIIASSLSSLPPRSLIVDLGCGDAELAKTLVPEGLNVLSFDLVSDGAWVAEADICTRVPLPGSEGNEGREAAADACVCSLSLMSTNWVGCVREAWRVLRMGGRFVVAEVTSRFKDTDAFVKVLEELGFELVEQTAPSTHFLLFEFRKVMRKDTDIGENWEHIRAGAESLLKPCEYKRR